MISSDGRQNCQVATRLWRFSYFHIVQQNEHPTICIAFSALSHIPRHCFRTDDHINKGFWDTSRTTMDAVPLKFVDSVVELFSRRTLDRLKQEVRHRCWKPVVDLHYRNRVYYNVEFWEDASGIKHIFRNITSNVNTREPDLSVSVPTLLKNRRFARIVEIKRDGESFFMHWEKVKPLGEAETGRLVELAASLIDQVSGSFDFLYGSPDCAKLLVTSLFKRVYLQIIRVQYCGQISYDFLEDQVNNSPFLSIVMITGKKWPLCSLELLSNFCLTGRPGKHVRVYLNSGNRNAITSNYIQKMFDLWKANGNLNFSLYFSRGVVDKEKLLALMNQGQVTWRSSTRRAWRQSFFKHETEKSLAVISDCEYLIECYTCECDRFKECLLKKKYRQHHIF
uniref:F-box domain-containing protein n=1 Tax=Steinernema glaseri TaxID=37863 RepID=A0A1I7Y3X6_9BILA